MRIEFRTGSRKRSSPQRPAWLSPTLATLLLFASIVCASAGALPASAASSLEYEVKAAFLFNFTKFVAWPSGTFATPDSAFTICIAGDDPFGRVLDQIVQGENVNGHKIAVERVQTDQQRSCQVLYVSRAGHMSALLSASPVLTVGEGDDFIHQGGIIGFVLDDQRVRFDINLKAATSSGLKLSSKLLSVARNVEK